MDNGGGAGREGGRGCTGASGNFGVGGYVHYLECGDGFVGVYTDIKT